MLRAVNGLTGAELGRYCGFRNNDPVAADLELTAAIEAMS